MAMLFFVLTTLNKIILSVLSYQVCRPTSRVATSSSLTTSRVVVLLLPWASMVVSVMMVLVTTLPSLPFVVSVLVERETLVPLTCCDAMMKRSFLVSWRWRWKMIGSWLTGESERIGPRSWWAHDEVMAWKHFPHSYNWPSLLGEFTSRALMLFCCCQAG